MLTTKEAIEKRRSIRKFKLAAVSPEILNELIEAARLAPSGSNAQPWRFKIVTNPDIKSQLAAAAHNQKFIAQAPAVLVCCASLQEYIDDMTSGAKDPENIKAVAPGAIKSMLQKIENLRTLSPAQLGLITSFHVAIAIEHIVLRALDFGLGTCWVKLIDAEKINQIFNWDQSIFVVALLPIGYPAEDPNPRKRKTLSEIII